MRESAATIIYIFLIAFSVFVSFLSPSGLKGRGLTNPSGTIAPAMILAGVFMLSKVSKGTVSPQAENK